MPSLARHIPRLFFKRGMLPVYLIFGITYRCNAKCRTCFYWQDMESPSAATELGLEEIERICRQLKNLIFVVMTGGEPFLRSDMPAICSLFYNISGAAKITIPTNCITSAAIEEKTRQILLENKGKRLEVNLSVDGVAGVHDFMRGYPGNFERFIETYKRLMPLKKRFLNFSVNLQTVVCGYNKGNLPELFKFVRDNMPGIDFHSFELLRGEPRSKDMRPLSAQEYGRVLPMLEAYWSGFKSRAGLVRRFKLMSKRAELEIMRQKRQVFPCYAGSVSGVIEPNGDVRLCEPLEKIGNIRDYGMDFKRLWFSGKAEEARRSIRRKDCFCTHSCFVASSLAFSPSAYASLFREKRP